MCVIRLLFLLYVSRFSTMWLAPGSNETLFCSNIYIFRIDVLVKWYRIQTNLGKTYANFQILCSFVLLLLSCCDVFYFCLAANDHFSTYQYQFTFLLEIRAFVSKIESWSLIALSIIYMLYAFSIKRNAILMRNSSVNQFSSLKYWNTVFRMITARMWKGNIRETTFFLLKQPVCRWAAKSKKPEKKKRRETEMYVLLSTVSAFHMNA